MTARTEGLDGSGMKPKTPADKKETANRRCLRRRIRPQPDCDFEALKACCNALESCSSLRMVDATLDFLNSKYRAPGVA